MSLSPAVRVALIGAGRIGTNHATSVHLRVPNADLVAIVDPVPGAARRLADSLGVERAETDPAVVFADPSIDAVIITASSVVHADLVSAAAAAGKAVFCEKPVGMSLDELDRVEKALADSGVVFQVGFNRRYADGMPQARAAIEAGVIGIPQLLRSVTRDPGLANPGGVPPWTIFTQTLIHDFDTLNFLNPGAHAVQVYAAADALVAPDFKDQGLLDTAVVTIRYDNGAIATAEASFSAAYGYDTRAEAFGSAGMIHAGKVLESSFRAFTAAGLSTDTVRSDTQVMAAAYTGELQAFVDAVAGSDSARPGIDAARAALAIAMACIESCTTGAPSAVQR